jgi:hypothetical protein
VSGRRRLRRGAWSAPELDDLRRTFGTQPALHIARRLRRTETGVRARAVVLFGHRLRGQTWSAADDARLRAGYGAVPDADLAVALRRSPAEVRARAARLRAQTTSRPWTAAEESLLKRVYGTRSSKALEVCLARPAADLEAAAARLCLRKDRRFLAGGGRRGRAAASTPRWTPADIVRLRALYPTTDNLAVARMIGRSVPSVANKAYQLGLKKRRRWLRQTGRASAARRWAAAAT